MTARIEDAGDRVIVWNGNDKKRGALVASAHDRSEAAQLDAEGIAAFLEKRRPDFG